MSNILEATIFNEKFQGEVVLLPWIPMILSDSPIPFKRLQFPIRLAFAVTIVKSQGQTMTIYGLDLENPSLSPVSRPIICCVFQDWETIEFVCLYSSRINQKHCTSNSTTINFCKVEKYVF